MAAATNATATEMPTTSMGAALDGEDDFSAEGLNGSPSLPAPAPPPPPPPAFPPVTGSTTKFGTGSVGSTWGCQALHCEGSCMLTEGELGKGHLQDSPGTRECPRGAGLCPS